ncbi:hypothetical protein [Jatrophihabitans sp.]|uniref:hypothetical protein n=1 Tax=Jatrophihabitans sp. TaxID=1932789 RepID=UPI0030C7198F|nr:hypothetical protein [Jatrophihabitans sp.]
MKTLARIIAPALLAITALASPAMADDGPPAATTLTFTSSPASTAVRATYRPVVTSNRADKPIVLSIDRSSSDTCRISNGVVTFEATGPCVIVATQAGVTGIWAPGRATQTVNVTP